MKILIDKENFVKISPEFGGRIVELVLNGHTILHANQPYDSTGSGIFLMFPWISKSPQNPYQPELKNHYHGFSKNTPREVEIQHISHSQILIRLREAHQHAQRHNFEEVYILRKGSLTIHFKVLENENDKHPYCFGYHPYLEINGKDLSELQIRTDIHTLLQFDENTLPIYPFKRREIKIQNKGTYNNLFEGGSYFELASTEGVHVKLSSDLPFWQIYNPAERNKIAVEPASFCGNLYGILKQDPSIKLSKEGKVVFEAWHD